MMRRVLMLSYYFPPLGGIGSIRALKFARYVPDYGWDPTVIAPRRGAYHRDLTLEFDERQVVRTGSLELSRIGKQVLRVGGDDTRAAGVGSVLRRVRNFARGRIYRPDAQIGWYPFALYSCRKMLRQHPYDVIFSSSFPITAHLVARRLHVESGIPWVAEFRDLWTSLATYSNVRRRQWDESTERHIAQTATAVVTVSEGYADVLRRLGGRSVSVITNGVDPGDFPEVSPKAGMVVTYVGTYYPDRQDLAAAIRGLGALARSGLLPGVSIRFIGEFPETLSTLLGEVGLAHAVQHTGFVPYRKALELMAESSLLLLAGPASTSLPRSELRGNIASKLFEYLASGRPILYVGELDSEAVDVLNPFPGVVCVKPGDSEGAQAGIASLLKGGWVDRQGLLEPYTRRWLARRLAGVLDEACQ